MVAEWVDIRPIFEVFANEMGYKGGERFRDQWWRQAAVEQQLKDTLKDTLTAAWERRRQESGRCGWGEVGE